jgi:ABC-type branched-subunit amino acid transport system ATPase component
MKRDDIVHAPLLQAEGLVKRYGGVIATDHVSLEIHRGDILGIIGPNGAGKSTLIGLLSGALVPSEGRIVFAGDDVTRRSAPDRARMGIGRTYQIPRPFLDMTVRENLLAAHYALHPRCRAAEAEAACQAILSRTGLADAAHLTGRALPLLRRKRLEVARALALKPRLLLLDEVGAGLVDAEVTELIELIQSLRDEVEAVIIIEHVLRVVRACCQRLLVVNFGKAFAQGPTDEVLASDEVAAVYLGTAHAPASAAPHAQAAPVPAAPPVPLDRLVTPALPGQGPLLELRHLNAGYGQAKVLNGLNLRVEAGHTVAVLGTNGAGKTTLANVLSGAIAPTAGEMRIAGQPVTGWAPHRIAALGMAQSMEGRRIFAPLTVEENLLLAAPGVPRGEVAARLEQVYGLFPDLAERRHRGGTSMSGGQQQMLAIGRALMRRPRLVVFDEISLGLAPVMMDRLYRALAELKRSGLTMLIVEQDVERALDLADEVHVMEHGRIALSGTARQLREDPRLRELYIGAETH